MDKTREKNTPAKTRQNLGETSRREGNQRGMLEDFLYSKGAFYHVNESDNDDESYNENKKQLQLP